MPTATYNNREAAAASEVSAVCFKSEEGPLIIPLNYDKDSKFKTALI
jgi:hypothetical protein